MRVEAMSLWVGFLLLGLPAAAAQQVPAELIRYPQTVFFNGPVLTLDTDQGDFTVAQALAIRDGKILAVGANDQVLRLAGPQTRRIDLKGKTVMPGIIDTHVHPNRYAISNYFDELPMEYQRLLRADGRIQEWNDKRQVLEEVRRIVEGHDPAKQWVTIASVASGPSEYELAQSITRFDLDEIAPDQLLYILIGGGKGDGVLNSKGLERIFTVYNQHSVPGVLTDGDGVATGQVRRAAAFIMQEDILPQVPAQVLAPLFAKELREKWAPLGHTTISSRLKATHIRAYALLDVEGKLPLRMAYGHEVGRYNPLFERDMKRNIAGVLGFGSDRLWMNAITVAPPDGGIPSGSICSTHMKLEDRPPEDIYPEGRCSWDLDDNLTWNTLRRLIELGYRIADIHSYGDKGNERAIDFFAELGVGPDTRIGLDHSVLFNRDLIRKSGELGVYWSVGSQKFLGDPVILARIYGREVVDTMAFPLKALLDAGAKVTYESSARRGDPGLTPFFDMQMFVTRRDGKGNLWGRQHALDRKSVLRMMTRWGAEYVLKEDKIGSLEPGKYADLIVLDKNPLDSNLADDRLSEIKILLTMVEGEVLFEAADGGL